MDTVRSMNNVDFDKENRCIEISFVNSEKSSYPYVWLKENCRCKQCFYVDTGCKIEGIKNLDIDVSPTDAKLSENGKILTVTWGNSHTSDFSVDWLHYRRFTEEGIKTRKAFRKRQDKLWGSDMQGNLPCLDFEKVLSDDKALHQWIVNVEEHGICLLKNVPRKSETYLKMAERLKCETAKTRYGACFTVKNEAKPAYDNFTSNFLPFHTDMPYLEIAPQVQLLHCLSQASIIGGDSVLADGFHIAEQMRKNYPEDFDMLSAYCQDYQDHGTKHVEPYCEMSSQPPIKLDHRGKLEEIRFSSHAGDSALTIPANKVYQMYKARCKFQELLHHPDNMIKHKLSGGEILTINNRRVLHGRLAFEESGEGERHLEVSYLNWGDLLSTRRVLDQKFGLYPQ